MATYNDDAEYVVNFTKIVTRGAFKYRPRDFPVMTGKALNAIVEEHGPDAVRTAEPR